ncbi:MAG: amidohydrolase family protein [Thermomicrobiales bacterium]
MRPQFIQNTRLPSGDQVDISIENGLIAAIAPSLESLPGAERTDAGGRLALPGFVDAHAHMDKSLLGREWYVNEGGASLQEMVDRERRYRIDNQIDFATQITTVGKRMIASGTVATRTFIDIDTDIGLRAFQGALAARERLSDGLPMQIVAFPQSGMLVRRGTVELLEEALRTGADVIGGLDPAAIDRDPKGHLDTIFGLADRFGCEVDIHLHEPGELGAFSMELIAERTRVLGLQGRVVISHAFSLGGVADPYLGNLIDVLIDNDIAIMSHGPTGGRPAPPVKRLHEAGVRLCAGNDGIRDTWGALNMPDMLMRAFLIAYRNNFRRDDEMAIALSMCTDGGAGVVGLPNYGLRVGSPADLVLLESLNPLEAMVERPPRWLVMKAGRIVAKHGECLIQGS